MEPINRSAKNTLGKISAAEISRPVFESLRRRGYLRFLFWLFVLQALIELLFLFLKYGLIHFPPPIGPHASVFLEGARNTLFLTLISGTIGLVIGLFVALAKVSRVRVFWSLGALFVWVLQGTPLLVQILFFYYAVPAIFPALKMGEFVGAALALSMNVGAYNAEVIRAGILAIPVGQKEAAKSLGLSPGQSMLFIILPQAFRIVVPPLMNNLVALLKDSSLASVIGLLELSLAGNRLTSETFQPVASLSAVALLYLLLTGLFTLFARIIQTEFRVAYGQR